MAVYTEIGDDELRAFTAVYDIGEVLSCKGIAEGVENSNFLLTTERANFILTLYEKRVAPGRRRSGRSTARRGASCAAARPRSSRFSTGCGRAASSRSTVPRWAAR